MTPPAASRGREARATPRADAEPGPDPADLAARLHDWQRMIRRRLATRSALAHVLLATHATLDPQRVADFLVSWAPGWWPLSIWAVVTSDGDGQVSVLSERGVTDDLASSVQAVGGWVMHSGEAFASGDLRRDDRLPGPSAAAVAALGFLLVGPRPAGRRAGRPRASAESARSGVCTAGPRVVDRAVWRRRASRSTTRCGSRRPRRCRSPTTSRGSTTRAS